MESGRRPRARVVEEEVGALDVGRLELLCPRPPGELFLHRLEELIELLAAVCGGHEVLEAEPVHIDRLVLGERDLGRVRILALERGRARIEDRFVEVLGRLVGVDAGVPLRIAESPDDLCVRDRLERAHGRRLEREHAIDGIAAPNRRTQSVVPVEGRVLHRLLVHDRRELNTDPVLAGVAVEMGVVAGLTRVLELFRYEDGKGVRAAHGEDEVRVVRLDGLRERRPLAAVGRRELRVRDRHLRRRSLAIGRGARRRVRREVECKLRERVMPGRLSVARGLLVVPTLENLGHYALEPAGGRVGPARDV